MSTVDDAEQSERLTIHQLDSTDGLSSFAHDVQVGLTSTPKQLLPKYFYDDLGSHLFEAICYLPEYYVTRAETEIITDSVEEIVDELKIPGTNSVRLIELGSGSAAKTKLFIRSLSRRKTDLHYMPVDISPLSLKQSSKELLNSYPQLRITAYVADFLTALQELQNTGTEEHHGRTVVLFLGSSIGNLNPSESLGLLKQVRTILNPGDVFLIGADLKKSTDLLIPAYADALGVTAAFNLNLLVRINRELGGNFELAKFEHSALYNEAHGRVEMHLLSREKHVVQISKIQLEVNFERGESIHTENSYKFDLKSFETLAANSGFHLDKVWRDRNGWFSLNLLAAI